MEPPREDRTPGKGPYGQRASASADAARRQQIARDLALTVEERMLPALSLGHALHERFPNQPPGVRPAGDKRLRGR